MPTDHPLFAAMVALGARPLSNPDLGFDTLLLDVGCWATQEQHGWAPSTRKDLRERRIWWLQMMYAAAVWAREQVALERPVIIHHDLVMRGCNNANAI